MRGLNKLYYLKKEIEAIRKEIESIPEISGIEMSGMPHSTNVSDPITAYLIKKDKLVDKLNRKINLYLDELIRIENIIDQIEDEEIRAIARMRFIQNMKWEDIGEQVHLDRTVCSKKVRKYFDTKIFDEELKQ